MGDKDLSDKDLSEPELYMALLGMKNNKSPDNDGLTKEFYVFFSATESKSFSLVFPIQLLKNKELSISKKKRQIKDL